MFSYWAVFVCLQEMLSPKLCLVHLCSRGMWIWAEVGGFNLMLILFHITLWKWGIFRPIYWAHFPAEFLKQPVFLSRSSYCIVEILLSSLPHTELFPCRVPSLQPGVGDGAAWGEHQSLSPVAPGLGWAEQLQGLCLICGCFWHHVCSKVELLELCLRQLHLSLIGK